MLMSSSGFSYAKGSSFSASFRLIVGCLVEKFKTSRVTLSLSRISESTTLNGSDTHENVTSCTLFFSGSMKDSVVVAARFSFACLSEISLAKLLSSGEALHTESSNISFSTFFINSSTADSLAPITTFLVVSGVTNGLPSRSPPIQDPNVKGVASKGNRGWPMFDSAVSIRRKKKGSPLYIVSWKYVSPCLDSSSGVGFLRRISSVLQAASIWERISSRHSIFSYLDMRVLCSLSISERIVLYFFRRD
mmetsp:Transcript_2748/g.8230  ORF Transcript_2748/g.8230 Transcript_2748/m.8230 type:complete len:248 (+) Transcript_2748:1755-2498(+)